VKKNYVIPFFIPHEGCPYQCIFCDQRKISGHQGVLPDDVAQTVEEYLSTIPTSCANIEIGFFGGTFTGLSLKKQEEFLRAVYPFIEKGLINGIRLSTRPDFIDKKKLDFLKRFRVRRVEIGVQSMSDDVLTAAKRGYVAKDVEDASAEILKEGFLLGHQIMVGLPFSSPEDEYYTAIRVYELGASQVRIYPVLVIEGTELASWWKAKKYVPLSEDEAVRRCVNLMIYFEMKGIKVIRCGLHPSEELLGGACLAGPFHPAFRQKVESRIFGLMLKILSSFENIQEIAFNPEDEAVFFGFKKENSPFLGDISCLWKELVKKDSSVSRGSIKVRTQERCFSVDKSSLAKDVLPDILL
jgi:histone acetyltransferase (RNA polymerase elongator complex component)